jgi:hypothetical protein
VLKVLADAGFLVRLTRRVSVVALGICLSAGCVAFVAVCGSLVKPLVDIRRLQRVSEFARNCSLGFVVVSIVIFAVLASLSKKLRMRKMEDAASFGRQVSWLAMAARGLGVACFVALLFAPFRYVRPEGNRWISTGKAGEWEVPRTVAWEYLWRSLRFNGLIVLCIESILASGAIEALHDVGLLEKSRAAQSGMA